MDRSQLQSHVDTLLQSSGVNNDRLLQVFQIQAILLLVEQQERVADATESFAETLKTIQHHGLAVENVLGGK